MVRTEQETATSVELQLDSLRQKADLEKLRYQESDIGYRIGYFVSVAFWLGYVFYSFWYAPIEMWYPLVIIFFFLPPVLSKVIIHRFSPCSSWPRSCTRFSKVPEHI